MMLGAYPFAALDPRTAYGVWRLRQAVFVLEQECLYPDLDGRDIEPGTRHVVLQDEHNTVVGCARVLDDIDPETPRIRLSDLDASGCGGDTGPELAPVWRIGRVVLAPAVRGQGWADRLMLAALEVCVDRDVVIDAQSPLRAWYASHGFYVTGQEFLDDGIPHLPMRRPGITPAPAPRT